MIKAQEKMPEAQCDFKLSSLEALHKLGSERSRSNRVRVHDEPAFVIASYPWSESSLIAELLTEHYGRVPVVVRGAKRPYSKFRGLINAFVPLLVNFSGTGDVKNLTDAKWLGGMTSPEPANMISGFYANELVLRMTVREDPAPELFKAYTQLLAELAHQKGVALQLALRRFEVSLLDSLGWGQVAKSELTENADALWCVNAGELQLVHEGVEKNPHFDSQALVSNACARAIIANEITEQSPLAELRRVLRTIIGYYVGDVGLNTRKTLSSWSQL